MISIIVPYKNAAPWIDRCCQSLTSMEGDGFEFVFIDDWSVDNGPEIVEKYQRTDNRFRMNYNRSKRGVAGARNTGIANSFGDWITFLDADDEMHPGAAAAFRRVIKQNRSANIYQFNHMRIYRDGKTVVKYKNRTGWYDIDNRPIRWQFVWNKLFRGDFILDNGINFEPLQYGEDEVFNLECLAVDNRIFCDDALTVIKHFDNTNSLVYRVGPEELIQHGDALVKFLYRQRDPVISAAVCRIISEHWGSKTFIETFAK